MWHLIDRAREGKPMKTISGRLLPIALLAFAIAACQPAAPLSSDGSAATPAASLADGVVTLRVMPTMDPSLPEWPVPPAGPSPTVLPISTTRDLPYTSKLPMDVYAPTSAGDWPIVILLHGAGQDKLGVKELANG